MTTACRLRERVLVVDDDRMLLELIRFELESEGFAVECVQRGDEALAALERSRPDAVVLDLGLPDVNGAELLRRLHGLDPDLPVVILTGSSEPETVVELIRAGAADFVPKPFDRVRLVASIRAATREGRLRSELASLRAELGRGGGFRALIGRSAALQGAVELLRRAARSEVTVLIEGESGTGKEVAARALHEESERAERPFVAINCGALPEGLVESELFGHEKGAFTGATGLRRGCFEEAGGGTLFLDEVGELGPEVQVRLLRALQERSIQRVGSSRSIPVDVRIVAATNRDLRAEVQSARFREDLYYRLAVFPVKLPPLRERDGDVLLLAQHFLDRLGEELRRPGRRLGAEASRRFLEHSWPGNVRELMNVVQRALLLEDGEEIGLESLAGTVRAVAPGRGEPRGPGEQRGPVPAGPAPEAGRAGSLVPLDRVLTWREYEERILRFALEQHDGCVQDAVRALGIGRATLYRKIERYGLRDAGSDAARQQVGTPRHRGTG